MAEAEQSVPKLPDLITHYKEVGAAWQRGRFLRNLRNLASVAVTVDEAAKRLELADPEELHHMIENDSEVRDTWRQTRQSRARPFCFSCSALAASREPFVVIHTCSMSKESVNCSHLPRTIKPMLAQAKVSHLTAISTFLK
jgi:hypothetical protein